MFVSFQAPNTVNTPHGRGSTVAQAVCAPAPTAESPEAKYDFESFHNSHSKIQVQNLPLIAQFISK